MAKSAATGIAVCAALVACAGNANAHVHKSHMQMTSHVQMTMTAPGLSSLTAKGGPLHDCVHVTFPQCGDRGFHGPND
jgi:hypothetical protein